MPHLRTVLPLRIGLAVLRLTQRGLPGAAGDALRRASALRLRGDERRAEAALDAFRQRLRTSKDTVEVVDYGAGEGRDPVRRIAQIYRRAATGPAWGRFLFGLTRGLQPAKVLELGTNLGVGAGHLAAALALNEEEGGPAGRLVTLEGAPALAASAAGSLARLGHTVGDDGCRVRVVVGPFAETLPAVVEQEAPFDLVFVDGHHEAEAALDYLERVRPALSDGAVVILDDVEPGRPVRRAWRHLREADSTLDAFYALKYGIFVHHAETAGAATAVARETAPPAHAAGRA